MEIEGLSKKLIDIIMGRVKGTRWEVAEDIHVYMNIYKYIFNFFFLTLLKIYVSRGLRK